MQMIRSNQLFEYQRTIFDSITISGIGVHSGTQSHLTLYPVKENTGIILRSSQLDKVVHTVPALWKNVVKTDWCTVLGSYPNHFYTVEHLMATLYAFGIDNVIIEIDGHEIPIMDGSAKAFVDSISRVGMTTLGAKRRYIRILKPVRICCGDSWAEFVPYDAMRFEIEIAFDSQVIGRQKWKGNLTEKVFCDQISSARTFGFLRDAKYYRKLGYSLGSSLENTVVISEDDKILNPEGLRYPHDEFVRHKAMDAIGDIALAGAQFIGCYRSYRGGHQVNHMALCALLSDHSAYEIIDDIGMFKNVSSQQSRMSSAPCSKMVQENAMLLQRKD
ncbi:MAG: UDP-3-O-acyl-N-acetylglucosamine deacetylase [Candidatus Liberibacter ctenarytainae]|uniref:UDP-3-O-acyl-N-acetylglucosamine deacetylase n=1 Tax=Candidatus Liberibacter ctenarytainae TaxID=2020335 RepID=A0A937AEV1_9HYPH|nr:UDP-3-O-acyl-N-acetylglucosamine deacetylase [Candidatus Liberibacter ctenarytainae]